MSVSAPTFVVTFLGTGSGVPTTARNLACVAVQRGGELFLFDCGEAAQIQYRRAGLGFARLTGIFISHMHGDHVTGLMGLLMSLQMADRTQPLQIVGPRGLADYIRCSRRGLHTSFGYPLQITEASAGQVVRETDAYRIWCDALDHRLFCLGFAFEELPRPGRFDLAAAHALGVPEGPLFGRLQRGESVELPDGRRVRPEEVLGPARPGAKVAYCTDTRPCRSAVTLGAAADLMIYEGTFAAEMAQEAAQKGHSTVVEAAEMAREAGARRLAITHISPRYTDPSPLLAQAREVFPETIIAEDLTRVEIFAREE
jgi:ribonuclease Z